MILEWLVLNKGPTSCVKRLLLGKVLFHKENLCHLAEDHNIIYASNIPLYERSIYLIFEELWDILIFHVKRIHTRIFDGRLQGVCIQLFINWFSIWCDISRQTYSLEGLLFYIELWGLTPTSFHTWQFSLNLMSYFFEFLPLTSIKVGHVTTISRPSYWTIAFFW